jgi:hypothetical protein
MWMGALALLAAGPALAAEPVLTTIEFGAELWGLNGDSVRQPMVPLVQKAAVPTPVLTDTVSVTPNAGGVTQVSNFPADFAGGTTITVSKTTGGATLLLANPTNRFDPFTAILTNVVHNEAGTARFHAGPNNWTAEVAVSLTTNICLDKVDTGGFCFFVANIDLPGAVGVTGGNKTFTGHVAQLSIPISGTLFGDKWTTGQKTVMKQIITARKNGDPAGTPTGFQTFTVDAADLHYAHRRGFVRGDGAQQGADPDHRLRPRSEQRGDLRDAGARSAAARRGRGGAGRIGPPTPDEGVDAASP